MEFLIPILTAALSKLGVKAIEDAYTSLKKLFVEKLGAESSAVEQIEALEKDNNSYQARTALNSSLKEAAIDGDQQILEAIAALTKALRDADEKVELPGRVRVLVNTSGDHNKIIGSINAETVKF